MRALIIPTRWECRPIIRSLAGVLRLEHRDFPVWKAGNTLILEPGMGPSRTNKAVQFLEQLELSELWLFGWCGGLSDDLANGDLVLSSSTQFAESTAAIVHPLNDALSEKLQRLVSDSNLRLVTGPVLTTGELLRKPEEKETAAARTGAIAVEMEAGPLAEWTRAREGLSFVHLRIVLDTKHSQLPRVLTSQNSGDILRMFNPIPWVQPRTWFSVWTFLRQIRTARKKMIRMVVTLMQDEQPHSQT